MSEPLRLEVTQTARQQIADAVLWLNSLPFEGAARRFSEALERVLPELCTDIAERLANRSNLP